MESAPGGTVPTGNFALSLSASSLTEAAGGAASVTVTATVHGGFNDTVNLSVSGLPSGVTASFSPASLTGAGSSSLTITAGTNAASGINAIMVAGTDASNGSSQSIPVTLVVVGPLPAFQYVRAITIDHTKVPNSDQSNFPVLVSGTYPYLATTANGGHVSSAKGWDIVFTSDAGCTTKLNYEIETWNGTSGQLAAWVQVPNLSHTSDTTVYVCYGSVAIGTDQSNQNGTWDGNFTGYGT